MSYSNIFTAKRNSPSVELGAFLTQWVFCDFFFFLTAKMEMIVSDDPSCATHGVDKDYVKKYRFKKKKTDLPFRQHLL